MRHSLCSSWAWIFERRRRIFPYTGCFTLRSTSTVMVLSLRSETTDPDRVRVPGCVFAVSLALFTVATVFLLQLPQYRLDPRDVAPGLLQEVRLRQVFAAALHPQVELLPPQADEFLLQRIPFHVPEFRCLHVVASPSLYITDRETTVVENGSFAAARSNARRATSSETPSIS